LEHFIYVYICASYVQHIWHIYDFIYVAYMGYKCKSDVYKTLIGDVVVHLKPHKFTVLSHL